MRICSKCKESKPSTVEYWHRNRSREDGLETICKTCKNDHNRKYMREVRKGNRNLSLEYFTRGMFRGDITKALNKYELAKKKYPIGKSYEVETRNRQEVYKFRGEVIQETDDFVTLQNNKGIRESFLKKDFYMGTKIKELS